MGRQINSPGRCKPRGRGLAVLPAVAAGLLAVLPGCGGHQAGPPPDPSGLSSEQLVRYAEQVLTGRCLREHGFEHYLVKPRPTDKKGERNPFRYAIDDVAWATEHGLDAPVPEQTEPERDPNARYVRGLSEADQQRYTAVYFGDPADRGLETEIEGFGVGVTTTGCLADARKKLYGSLEAWFRPNAIADNLGGLARRQVTRDPRYHRAVADWSACMRARGINATSPDHLREQLAERAAAEPLERRWAVAEAECATSTGLTSTARELESQHDRAIRQKYRTELDRLHTINNRAAIRAREIVGN